jgi:hypothetical protein
MAARRRPALLNTKCSQRDVVHLAWDDHVKRQRAILCAALDDVARLHEQRLIAAIVDAKLRAARFVNDGEPLRQAVLQRQDAPLELVLAVNEKDREVAMRVRPAQLRVA